ncbi:MAG TPA: DUF1800 domain-containing protein, partial [Phnomibacter sp.]|nr:DUF1800 domain-containing protein [Phnomibacter sp.]
MLSISHHTNHLLWRAGFGPTPDMLSQPTPFNAHTYFEALVIASQKTKLQPLEVSKNLVDGLANGIGQLGRLQQLSRNEQLTQRQQMARQSRQELRSLNLLWLEEMVQSTAQLREKMALFWHGHFACRNLNSYFQQHLLQQIRENALGNFGALLHAVSKSPAMLAFLNNQQNRKQSPNENFAREVMELFTLGRGNYTELDIKEAARAFTGWGFDASGQFVFRRLVHDAGTKTVLGTTGNLTGDEVLDLLLAKKQTALFITQKLYRFLVNETAPPERIAWLAERFYQSGYEILPLLKDIFTAKWFYNQENIGNRIKGPIDWWVGLRRMLPMQIANPEIQLLLQRSLGQVLFYPPNVAGWPGVTNWIDGNSLLL